MERTKFLKLKRVRISRRHTTLTILLVLCFCLYLYNFFNKEETCQPDTLLPAAASPDKYSGAATEKYVYYKCGKECSTQGLVDRVRGAMFAYLLSKALNRTFAMDLDLACFENILQQNEIKWQSTRYAAEEAIRSEDFYFWKFNHADGIAGKYRQMFATPDAQLLYHAQGNKVLRVSQNAMAFQELAASPKYGSHILRLLGVNYPQDVTYEKVAGETFDKLFQITPQAKLLLSSLFDKVEISGDAWKSGSSPLLCAHYRLKEIGSPCEAGCQRNVVNELKRKSRYFPDPPVFYFAADSPIDELCNSINCLVQPETGRVGHTAHTSTKCRCSVTQRALLDLLILRRCDIFYMTLRSGFSNFPHFIRTNRSQEAHYIDPWYTGA